MVSAETRRSEGLIALSSKDLGIRAKPPKRRANVSFALWIRSLMQNWRQGTVSCKGRSDVARSGRKPWKQKGTGRARAGTARSPLWRGGGVIFGPQVRRRKLRVSKSVKNHVFRTILHDFLLQNKIVSLDWMAEGDSPQTSAVYKILKQAGLLDKRILIFLSMEDQLTYTSLRNLPNVCLVFFDQANAFDLIKSDYWVVFKKDLDHFKKMVSRWT